MNNYQNLSLLDLRQGVSLALFFLSVALVIVFFRYLLAEAKTFGWNKIRTNPVNQAAIALIVYFSAMSVTRLWSVVFYASVERGTEFVELENTYYIALLSTAFAVVGGLCMVRVFTESHLTWVSVLGVISALTVIGVML
jgi:hypothetical protein